MILPIRDAIYSAVIPAQHQMQEAVYVSAVSQVRFRSCENLRVASAGLVSIQPSSTVQARIQPNTSRNC